MKRKIFLSIIILFLMFGSFIAGTYRGFSAGVIASNVALLQLDAPVDLHVQMGMGAYHHRNAVILNQFGL